MKRNKTAIIIGAGPAGLAAAYELLDRTDIKPIIFEQSNEVGGLAKTITYKGNKMDIGPHRFYSKSDRIMEWWQQFLAFENSSSYHPENNNDKCMIKFHRVTRILFLDKLIDYPISLSFETLKKLGFLRICYMGLSYCKSIMLPRKQESLEDFYINRFGKALYRTFFKDYTEKIWGVQCSKISPDWGAQRIKGLSITKVISNSFWSRMSNNREINQKYTETSLIDTIIYPKLGSGQMWDDVAKSVIAKGGEIFCNKKVTRLISKQSRIVGVEVSDNITGETTVVEGDYFISTMPISDLAISIQDIMPENIKRIADGLSYRDHILVGLLVKEMEQIGKEPINSNPQMLPDHWIYIQDKNIKMGRFTIVNNWSQEMLMDSNTVWLGLEYFCSRGDDLWNRLDGDIIKLAIKELVTLGLIKSNKVLDATVIRTEKAYPAYFGTYNQFNILRNFIIDLDNLFLIGRNGMHRYNNMDHSVLTGIMTVDNISRKNITKADIWAVNTEQKYHEIKT